MKNAHGTLLVIVVVLGLLLLGIGHLAADYRIMAMDQTKPGYQSVISQLVGAVYGRGWFYYVTIASVLAVLCLSANTSFVGFPRLCRLVAADGFLPRAFAIPGRRLVYSAGILFLTIGSGALLIGFGGITDRLIPLFAVGAFLAFTMSQAGMAAHWRRAQRSGQGRPGRIRAKFVINGGGAIATGIALAIILAAKFLEGAWLTIIVIPLTLALLRAVHRYYEGVDAQVLEGAQRSLDLTPHRAAMVLVPIARWDRVTRKALRYAMEVSDDVTALHITELEGPDAEEHDGRLRAEWREFVEEPARRIGRQAARLRIVQSQYRSVLAPLLREIEAAGRSPGRPVFVVLPEIVEGRWWQRLLHIHRERRLRSRLLRYGGPDVAVIGVPWQLEASSPQTALAEEEPVSPAAERA